MDEPENNFNILDSYIAGHITAELNIQNDTLSHVGLGMLSTVSVDHY